MVVQRYGTDLIRGQGGEGDHGFPASEQPRICSRSDHPVWRKTHAGDTRVDDQPDQTEMSLVARKLVACGARQRQLVGDRFSSTEKHW
jgi:hypothetical protein